MRRRRSGGRIPPPSTNSDHVPALLSPGRSTSLRPGETHVEAMARLLEGIDLGRLPAYGPEPERGPDRFGRRWFVPATRPPWWRRLMRWRP